jgi:Archaeal fructose-1,6-bisphosphatase and related enzymes of inositol monophosphatase family
MTAKDINAILPFNYKVLMHPLLNTAIKAARRAGSIITRASEDISSLTITSKNMNDFVSEVDLASEKEIIRVLSQAYPDHGFIAEESGLSEKKRICGSLIHSMAQLISCIYTPILCIYA